MNLLSTQIKDLLLDSPLMTASGTSGHSNEEIEKLRHSPKILSSLGAFVTKGVTLEPSKGNPPPRIVEVRSASGIINSIGLQNSGVKFFAKNELPNLLNLKKTSPCSVNIPIIVNISAGTINDFGNVAAILSEKDSNKQIIKGVEINVSCPNIKEGGVAFGTDPVLVEQIVELVRKKIDPRIVVITKLTPNVTDITIPAQAAINGGTDALSMINTLRGVSIDIYNGRPFLGNKTGGFSGPAIKPVGVFMVYECFRRLRLCREKKIPIIGIGGISTWQDALEYIMAGASAVAIGTAWFVNPMVFHEIYSGLLDHLTKHKQGKILSDLIGIAHRPSNEK